MVYLVCLNGGPHDGSEVYCFRPYFRLNYENCVYAVIGPYMHEEHCEWVDDDTRRIEMYYQVLDEQVNEVS